MNATELVGTLEDRLKDTRLVIVANREPYIHVRRTRENRGLWARLTGRRESVDIDWVRPASGLVTALDPVMRACGGTWIGHGSGSGDREVSDAQGRVEVPPDDPSYTLRRVWLTPEEEQGYYYGMSNNALWPLCHIAYARPEFNERDWGMYVRVNQRFAETVLEEIHGMRALVFVQDYHFGLLPRFIKDARPDVVVCQFWHIPWPNPEAFRVCPWADDLLHGLLGNDLLTFHIQHHCNNFFDTVDKSLEARVDNEQFAVWRGGRPTFVKPFPISIDPEIWAGPAKPAEFAAEVRVTRRHVGLRAEKLIFGVDRLDYTKGIPDRLHAFERLLDSYPEWHGRVVLLQVGAPSRASLAHYEALSMEVDDLVARINRRHGTERWTPVIYRHEHYEPREIAALYRAADVCVVSSLHDGMNLVAKEFIASRSDHRGVLVLSRFTGAARDLEEAVLVNPYAIDEFAEALHESLLMDPDQQERRMQALYQRVQGHTVYDWAADILQEALLRADAVRN
ncbi:MAG: trehalose-6-phosphate synthase [Vicinamibacterales bacterium]